MVAMALQNRARFVILQKKQLNQNFHLFPSTRGKQNAEVEVRRELSRVVDFIEPFKLEYPALHICSEEIHALIAEASPLDDVVGVADMVEDEEEEEEE